VFSLQFTPSHNKFLIGGGGGSNKSGVKNAVVLYEIDFKNLGLDEVSEYNFSKQDDGCMSIAVHPKVFKPI
jgi:prolactin regulatory element-binding protein